MVTRLIKSILQTFKKAKDFRLRDDSAQSLATMNSLNRRKNTRIKYSHLGAVGDLPKVYYQGDEMIVGNISTGGLLLVDDTEVLGNSVGAVIQLTLKWPDTQIETKGRIVGAQLQRRHIQFVDFNALAFVRISKLIKFGFLGSRFHRVKDNHAMLDAEELWVGPTGESLCFPRINTTEIATLNYQNHALVIERKRKPFWRHNKTDIDHNHLGEILVLLSNFPLPTPLIKDLIERLQMYFDMREEKGTGTDGSP